LANIGPHVNDSPFADQYSKLRLIVLRAKIAGKLSDGVLPGDFVSWAEKTGVDLPTGLKNAVRAAVQRIEDRESIISERESLRAEAENLKAEWEAERSSEGSLKPRERESLISLKRLSVLWFDVTFDLAAKFFPTLCWIGVEGHWGTAYRSLEGLGSIIPITSNIALLSKS
jgi:hypothetical protein